jgi:FERM central domain/RA like domain
MCVCVCVVCVAAEETSELWAAYALERLQRLYAQGVRRQPVSVVEFDNVCERRRVFPISIYLSDSTYKQIYIDSVSTADEIADQIADEVGLQDARGYAIFEVFGKLERSLDDKDKFTDELWKLEVLRVERERQTALADSASSKGGGKSASKSAAAGKGKAPVGAEASAARLEANADLGSGDMQLLFKRKLHMDPHALSPDAVENALLFHQTSAELLAGRLPCTQGEAVKLGALLVTLEHGDVQHSRKKKQKESENEKGKEEAEDGGGDADDAGGVGDTLLGAPTNYLPDVLVNNSKLTAEEWKRLLREEHAKVPAGLGNAELRIRFLEFAKSLPMFGTHIFLAAHKSDWDMPVRISVGVSIEGV